VAPARPGRSCCEALTHDPRAVRVARGVLGELAARAVFIHLRRPADTAARPAPPSRPRSRRPDRDARGIAQVKHDGEPLEALDSPMRGRDVRRRLVRRSAVYTTRLHGRISAATRSTGAHIRRLRMAARRGARRRRSLGDLCFAATSTRTATLAASRAKPPDGHVYTRPARQGPARSAARRSEVPAEHGIGTSLLVPRYPRGPRGLTEHGVPHGRNESTAGRARALDFGGSRRSRELVAAAGPRYSNAGPSGARCSHLLLEYRDRFSSR